MTHCTAPYPDTSWANGFLHQFIKAGCTSRVEERQGKRGQDPGTMMASSVIPTRWVCLLSCPLQSPKPTFSETFPLPSDFSVSCSPKANIYTNQDAGTIHAGGTNSVYPPWQSALAWMMPKSLQEHSSPALQLPYQSPGMCLHTAARKAVLFLLGENKWPVANHK